MPPDGAGAGYNAGMAGPDDPARIAVLGAGSWGTALAIHTERRGHSVALWTRTPEHAEAMRSSRENHRYLAGRAFGDRLEVHEDLADAIAGAQLVVLAVPSHGLRAVLRQAASALATAGPRLLIAAKGVEVDSLATMFDVVLDELGEPVRPRLAVLGGPSFAAEVAAGKPTAVVVGCTGAQTAEWIQRAISGHGLRGLCDG